MNIDYRHFNNADYNEQRKLFELSFPETIGTNMLEKEHYEWKFKQYPGSIPSYEYVASEPQEMVGYYAAIPYQYQVNKKVYTCGMVCDVMTHPDRRGKGIFTKIGHYSTNEMKIAGLAFTTGYPIRPEVIPGHMKVGWKIVLKMPMYLRIVTLKTLLPRPLRFLSPLLNLMNNVAQCWTLLPEKSYAVENLSRAEFLALDKAAYNDFLTKWLTEQQNALVKSMDFLEWRTNAPQSVYRFLILRKEKQFVGLSIIRPTTLKGVESLAVLDFMVLKEHFRGCTALQKELWKSAKTFKKDVIVAMTSADWASRYKFFSSLFIKTPAVFELIVKKLDETIPDQDLYSPDRWHLFWIDSDDV